MFGDGSWGSIHVESAFGDFGEDDIHWICSFFWIKGGHSDHIHAVCGELVAQEPVCEVDLTNHIDKVQEFTEEEVDGIASVCPQIFLEVHLNVHNLGDSFFRLVGNKRICQISN